MKLVPKTAGKPFPNALDALTFRFEDLPRALRRIVDIAIQDHSLNRSQWRLLAYVLRDEGMTQTELARMLELERASVGQAIDALERKQLVERAKSPGDRRVWRIYATEKGRLLVPALRETINEIYEQVFAGFSDQEITLLSSMLERIMTNLEE
jgi:DNA-binding MarR family transcriptional regulator